MQICSKFSWMSATLPTFNSFRFSSSSQFFISVRLPSHYPKPSMARVPHKSGFGAFPFRPSAGPRVVGHRSPVGRRVPFAPRPSIAGAPVEAAAAAAWPPTGASPSRAAAGGRLPGALFLCHPSGLFLADLSFLRPIRRVGGAPAP